MRVLIADHNRSVIDGYREVFPRYNIEIVATAADGIEAVDQFRLHAKGIDLVLCDSGLPRISGFEVARRIRSLEPQAVIIVVGESSPNVTARLKAGVRAVINRPQNVEELVHQLYMALTQTIGQAR